MNRTSYPYETVASRIRRLRNSRKTKKISVETRVIHLSNNDVVIRASIQDASGRLLGTGIAHEVKDTNPQAVNYQNFVENCETFAVGRALNFAFGPVIRGEFCSSALESPLEKDTQNNNLPLDGLPEAARDIWFESIGLKA